MKKKMPNTNNALIKWKSLKKRISNIDSSGRVFLAFFGVIVQMVGKSGVQALGQVCYAMIKLIRTA